eukprot:765269-Hanusia_phi.AAC.14
MLKYTQEWVSVVVGRLCNEEHTQKSIQVQTAASCIFPLTPTAALARSSLHQLVCRSRLPEGGTVCLVETIALLASPLCSSRSPAISLWMSSRRIK